MPEVLAGSLGEEHLLLQPSGHVLLCHKSFFWHVEVSVRHPALPDVGLEPDGYDG